MPHYQSCRDALPTSKRIPWSTSEDKALVQFVSLHQDEQPSDSVWPGMKAHHPYWSKAAKFVQETTSSEKRTGETCI